MARGFLGLGSNLGDRRAHLTRAVTELVDRGVEVTSSSSTYDTEPVGLLPDQPDFLNACLAITTDLQPLALLDVCKAVERAGGRSEAGVRHGPRPVDVDLLLLGDVVLQSARLTLPHPEIASRRFVLVPLLELEPALRLPDGTALEQALPALGDGQRVQRAGPPLL